ncbi:MAG TPA: ATPase P [Firmicutes bacterium]|nr:ATPase P [Bacillota bacterium]
MKSELKEKITGLTEEKARQLHREGKYNVTINAESLTEKQIIKKNVFTYFNFVFLIISILLILVGSFRDLTFLPLIITNTLIGVYQEIRSKRTIDKLTMLNAPKVKVLRDSKIREIPSEEVVLGDIIFFEGGNQICVDAKIVEGHVSVNESLITGEANEIAKSAEDELLSGSFIVSGTCYAEATKVGAESYISKLTLEAKKMKNKEQSNIIKSLNKIVGFAGIAIVPIGLTLFLQQFFLQKETLRVSVQGMVASVIGMIPEGLFLLASVTLAISAMRLAKQKVLLHDMKSIETLARVDVLCVDKTGTITDNSMQVETIDILKSSKKTLEEVELLVGDFADAQSNDNVTMKAIKEYFTKTSSRKIASVSGFSAEFKYSGVNFENATYVLGAPEFVLKDSYKTYQEHIEEYTKKGLRVLVFGHNNEEVDGKKLTGKFTPYAFIVLSNNIRKNAKETFEYFKKQQVEIKVISGDDPQTVSEIAKKAGIENAEKYIDASSLDNLEEITDAILNYTVFGRVTPDQKKIFVQVLQEYGHTVAMTGDGVNDVLALKEADCSIAMASGSDAAKQVSQIVLLESDFSKMPKVIKEGRQVVNNLERSGSLFLVKNIFSFLTSIMAIYWNIKYPLTPAHISLISTFTIGLPAFLLSQVPTSRPIRGTFIKNVLYKAVPGGLVDTLVVSLMVYFAMIFNASPEDISTSATILLAVVGLMVLYNISKPMDKYKWGIWIVSALGIVGSFIFLKDLFSIAETMSIQGTLLCINFALISEVLLRYLTKLFDLTTKILNYIKKRMA